MEPAEVPSLAALVLVHKVGATVACWPRRGNIVVELGQSMNNAALKQRESNAKDTFRIANNHTAPANILKLG